MPEPVAVSPSATAKPSLRALKSLRHERDTPKAAARHPQLPAAVGRTGAVDFRSTDVNRIDMNPPPIYFVLGTRAQIIKTAPVIKACARRDISYRIILTGQHKQTVEDLFRDFEIAGERIEIYKGPEVNGILRMALWLPYSIWQIITHSKEIMPNRGGLIVVHGDTVSTLAGALAGFFLCMRVAHIESGLRSFNIFHPFPEELVRLAIFRLCNIAFCPGPWAAKNMQRYRCEVVDTERNTIVDAMRLVLTDSENINSEESRFGLVSIHRFENIFFRDRLLRIIENLEAASAKIRLVFVLHPATERRLKKFHLYHRLSSNEKIQLLPRMGYSQFIRMAVASCFVITDGGSNQEELSLTNIPVFLMRRATERREGLGSNVVLGNYDEQRFANFLATALINQDNLEINIGESSPAEIITSKLVALSRQET